MEVIEVEANARKKMEDRRWKMEIWEPNDPSIQYSNNPFSDFAGFGTTLINDNKLEHIT